MIKISAVSSCSDPGNVASENQDTIYCSPEDKYWLLADGIGGTKGGKLASELAISSMSERLSNESIQEASSRTQQLINARQEQQPEHCEMGTTIAVAKVAKYGFEVAWLGDSRIYNYSKNNQSLQLLSRDHSVVQDRLDRGELTPNQAMNHPERNLINRFLGMKSTANEIEVRQFKPTRNGILFLCSDGVTDYVSEHTIQSILSSTDDLRLCRQKLQQSVLTTEAQDNFSFILISYEISIATKLQNIASKSHK